ncbi:hypothetical protein SAMN06273572_11075 [Monaibacterium marinum]|uniref:Uncharacterized protein n=1 Tax=Pontivivens marinum TaxID=1690039 RepID=A0A2C9CV85_9RHOB|nr:hypothetical protein [Monaibacterium marinum]SOH95401.1 hypothetical protein SAMN06273572_11075 [Monaibacterium marinum]
MEDIDEHIGHRYVPGHERAHCDWACEIINTTMQFWELVAMVAGGILVFSLIFGIRRLMRIMAQDKVVVRGRTEAEKQDHLRTLREMRKSR